MASPIPSLGCESSARRVLAIPELLQRIFDFGTRASNASNALVCRSWSGPALDHVWREVDSLYYLLRLLVPLLYHPGERRHAGEYDRGNHKFDHSPTPEEWARFIPYARRVHSLKVKGEMVPDLADSVFDELARTRITLEILPNLRCLHWNIEPRIKYAVVFMHDKVTEFSFDYSTRTIPSLASDVLGRMPFLTSLEWMGSWRQGQDSISSSSLLRLLSGLQKLQRITLPKDFLDYQLLKPLSLLPELRVVQCDGHRSRSLFIPVMKGTLEGGAFPMLYNLCLHSTLDDMRHYLTGGVLLPRLKNLSTETAQLESPSTVKRFIADVTECYPALEVVSFVTILQRDDREPLSLEHLRPLVSLKQLTRLELRHNLPIQISEEDLVEFSAAFPTIETLVLNPEPLLLKRPKFTLSSLLFVARNFPNLSHLGIYLDAKDATTGLPYSLGKTQTFLYLRTLDVGVSPIGADHASVALFLSRLLSESEVIIQLRASSDGFDEGEIRKRYSKWKTVANALPLLLRLLKEEKERRKDIEREVEDLRMRVNEGSKTRSSVNMFRSLPRLCQIENNYPPGSSINPSSFHFQPAILSLSPSLGFPPLTCATAHHHSTHKAPHSLHP
ncbi:hypothetical protein BC827DRAFT_1264120 [Russula dissimulans]|nr:hypothetical protein BC827DRAFT_1264120 [Russula dissimulans]